MQMKTQAYTISERQTSSKAYFYFFQLQIFTNLYNEVTFSKITTCTFSKESKENNLKKWIDRHQRY